MRADSTRGAPALQLVDRCPIWELLRAVNSHGKPSLAWAMRWSVGGVDPVHGAWAALLDAQAARSLLWLIDPMRDVPAKRLCRRAQRAWLRAHPPALPRDFREVTALCAFVLRRSVAAPTLAEVLAAAPRIQGRRAETWGE